MPASFVKVPRERCFSLGDLHDFERCPFSFFVRHHLQKKYELEEASENQAIGSLLDLAIKKYHSFSDPSSIEDIASLIKAAERHMREDVSREGERSYYGPQAKFLTPEAIKKATDIWVSYYNGAQGHIKKAIHQNKLKPFWKYQLMNGETFLSEKDAVMLWGGPDAIEMGEDGVPEVVDYKYFEDPEKGKDYLDMDLMPKLYMLLTSQELGLQGYKKARFKVRFWQNPKDESMYEDFDLTSMPHVANYLLDKVRRILGVTTLSFCNKPYCRVCNNDQKESWIKELQNKGWIKVATGEDLVSGSDVAVLPF